MDRKADEFRRENGIERWDANGGGDRGIEGANASFSLLLRGECGAYRRVTLACCP